MMEAGEKVLLGGYGFGGATDANDKAELGRRHVGSGTIAVVHRADEGSVMEITDPLIFTNPSADTGQAVPANGDSGSLVFRPDTGEAVGMVEGAGSSGNAFIVNLAGAFPEDVQWLKSYLPYFQPFGYDSGMHPLNAARDDAAADRSGTDAADTVGATTTSDADASSDHGSGDGGRAAGTAR